MARRAGVYVDASNIDLNGGYGLRYDVLRDLACRGGGEPQRLNVYLAYDERRAERDPEYAQKSSRFHAAVRDQGFRVTIKPVKHYIDGEGNERSRSNADLDMAVDALTESDRLDSVMLVTGDGDFNKVVRALQSRGCRVEILAFDNVSRELKDEADVFINGYLIPGLAVGRDAAGSKKAWGEFGSRVRGICYNIRPDENFGFFSYWQAMPEGNILTTTGMKPAYFKTSSIPESVALSRLPSRQIIFEFELVVPTKPDAAPEAREIEVVSVQ
ncbi:NYN domain-containing protein [Paraburkholderia sp. J8-2]|uniref:LabA-like NYN domain-containing protein n=1 Tax=Paraburkholderia sp. J8-2 TaxID=2805440 RepID=UPI002AB7AA89|nr:NYN domain-containing protein [Paraburkholderia sp. J8-2]